MSIPTAYSEAELASYLHAHLGAVATVLGFTAPVDDDLGSYEEAVNDTLIAYGVSDIASATDIATLRALARVQAWQMALRAAAARYDVSDGTQSLKRSQLLSQIKEALSLASDEAATLTGGGDSSYTIGRASVIYADDPYQRVGGP